MMLNKQERIFQQKVWDYYHANKRDLPWRRTDDPYQIWISEMMLQQTQTDRVLPKYEEFLGKFPTVNDLAKASLRDVIQAWQGLGYNRRAKYVLESAQIIVRLRSGVFPHSKSELESLPGVGPYTASAVRTFAFGKCEALIETNIRTVYLYFFFKDRSEVSDADIELLVERTMDKHNPKEWLNALMDYGSMLKKTVGNNISQSKHYTKQPSFKGSNRELRGKIVRLLTLNKKLSKTHIVKLTKESEQRIKESLSELEKDALIEKTRRSYALPT